MSERAIVYARVSGDDRGKGNLSDQLEMGREYALSKGYQIVTELAEDEKGASGYEMDLPQLTHALEMARDNALDVLIVRDLGRFARRLVKQLVVEREFIEAGIRVEYVLGKYPNTPEGRLQKNIEASIREWQREDIATRTARKRRKMVKDGNVMTHGRPPYGYRVAEVEKDELVIYEPGGERQNGKRKKRERRVKRREDDGLETGKRVLVIHEPEARVVRMIFDWYVVGDGKDGPLSMHVIAKRLTEMEIPTWQDIHGMGRKRRKRNHWVIATISDFLSNETFAGVWYYGRRGRNGTNPREHWISVDVPPIVSRTTWETAQARKRKNRATAKRNNKYDYLLRYRVRCGQCKTSMYSHSTHAGGKVYLYYICGGHEGRVARVTKCATPHFRVDHVDPTVWAWVCNLFTNREVFMQGLRREQERREETAKPLRDQLAVTDDLLVEHKAKLERALSLYLAGGLMAEMLTERKRTLEKTIADLEGEQARLVARLEAATLTDEQIETLAAIIEEVGEGLDLATFDFQKRRWLIEKLNLTARLEVKDGQKFVHVECYAGYQTLPVVSDSSSAL